MVSSATDYRKQGEATATLSLTSSFFGAVLFAMLAEGEQGMAGQDAAKPFLPLQERQLTQIFTGAEHQIKDAIEQFGLMTKRVLEQLKARHTLAVERHQLAIQDGVYLHAL